MNETQQLEVVQPSEWLNSKVTELNNMLRTDPVALDWMMKYEVKCTDALAYHGTTTTCRNDGKNPYYSIGCIGVLNAVLAEPPWYVIVDFENDIAVRFRLARYD